ncbi:MAG: copper-translocating P-type ATPase [Syntrophothermus sp.]
MSKMHEEHNHSQHLHEHQSDTTIKEIKKEDAHSMHQHKTIKDEHKKHNGNGHAHHEGMIEDFKKRFWISIILTIPVLILSPMLQMFAGLHNELRFPGDTIILFILSSIIFVYGGYPFLQGFVNETVKEKRPAMMTLIAIAITTAYVYSSLITFGLKGEDFFWELATLIDIMLVGHWIEMKSVMKASRALEELAKLLPSEPHKFSGENTIDVPIEELIIDDLILIKPGEKIPADSVVIDGKSNINESMLTGESKPVQKQKDDVVIGGSINGEGSLKVKVSKLGKDSFLSQVIKLVEEAQKSKSRTQNLADRAAFWLTILALASGIITFFVWNFLITSSATFALERTVTVMVIACPHALGLAVPLVVSVSTSLAARNGFLIRNRAAFESARMMDAVVFDKTGTLTKGEFGVNEVLTFNNFSKEQVIDLAAALEAHSQHPIAQGIVSASKNKKEAQEFNSITGKGIEGVVDNKNIKVVSPGYLIENKILYSEDEIQKLQERGNTVVFLLVENKVAGAISLGDIIREESKEAIRSLHELGVKVYMLTGDNKSTAKYVADELGIDEYIAEVLPHQKTDKIKEIQQKGYKTAMTGDGVNDAPALAQADIGIAIGAGSDVAVETADIVLIRSNPNDIPEILDLSRKTYKKMIQNLWWALGYNIFAIPLAAGVLYKMGILLSPALGAVLMSLSTVIVALNAQLLRIKKPS